MTKRNVTLRLRRQRTIIEWREVVVEVDESEVFLDDTNSSVASKWAHAARSCLGPSDFSDWTMADWWSQETYIRALKIDPPLDA